MGPPASGKGSQKPFLTKQFNIPQISTGEMFRAEIKKQTPFGKKIDKLLSEGKFVKDEITNKVVELRLLEEDVSNGFVLDGYPRTINQAEFLDKFLESQNLKLDYVFILTAPKDLLIKRIVGRRTCPNCGAIYNIYYLKSKVEGICDICGATLTMRADDTEEIVKERLLTYQEKTAPILDFYEKKGLLVSIDGSGAPIDSFKEIMEIVDKK